MLCICGGKGSLNQLMNELINYEAVYRTAPATLGLLKNQTYKAQQGRAPADSEVSIKDSGLRRPGLGVAVLCLTLPPDQEDALAWQGQSGPGAERDSWSCIEMFQTGTGSGAFWAETVQRESRKVFTVLFVLIEQCQKLE